MPTKVRLKLKVWRQSSGKVPYSAIYIKYRVIIDGTVTKSDCNIHKKNTLHWKSAIFDFLKYDCLTKCKYFYQDTRFLIFVYGYISLILFRIHITCSLIYITAFYNKFQDMIHMRSSYQSRESDKLWHHRHVEYDVLQMKMNIYFTTPPGSICLYRCMRNVWQPKYKIFVWSQTKKLLRCVYTGKTFDMNAFVWKIWLHLIHGAK